MDKIETIPIAEIKRLYNPGIGRHWFDRDSMTFFRTELPQQGYSGPGGIYFVTSEKFIGPAPSRYTVRRLVGEKRD